MTSDELTARREVLGLNQAELARMLGVPPLTVWKWEHANQKVPALMDMALRGVQATLEEQPRRRRRKGRKVSTEHQFEQASSDGSGPGVRVSRRSTKMGRQRDAQSGSDARK